jgi:hypothetical protein
MRLTLSLSFNSWTNVNLYGCLWKCLFTILRVLPYEKSVCCASLRYISTKNETTVLSFAQYYFFYRLRLSRLGIAATVWPIIPAPDDRWGWLWGNRWNVNWQGKPKYSENACPSATLSTTNPTWPEPGSNPRRRGGNPATNRLSYGMARLHSNF